MRDRETIEREIYGAREDLEQNLAELKDVIADKVNIPAKARHAVEVKKEEVVDFAKNVALAGKNLAYRGRDAVVDGFERAKETTRERPVLVASLLAGALTVGVLTVLVIHRQRQLAC